MQLQLNHCSKFLPPGLEAEVILNEDGDAEEDNTLDGHREQVLSHHVPGQRRAEPVFTCSRRHIFSVLSKTNKDTFLAGGNNGLLCFTESLQSISHCLILHHVNKSSPQAEVREDEEHVLQDIIDTADLLKEG